MKLHAAERKPTSEEWLRFLAGCFTRRIEHALFVTTGRLGGEQRREAQEGSVVVIAGRDELDRLARRHGLAQFGGHDGEAAQPAAVPPRR